MSRGLASNSKYSYNHLNGKGPSEAIDIHDITVKKSRLRIFLSYFGAAVFLTATFYLVVLKVSTNHPSGLLTADISHIILSICSFYLPIDKFQGKTVCFSSYFKEWFFGQAMEQSCSCCYCWYFSAFLSNRNCVSAPFGAFFCVFPWPKFFITSLSRKVKYQNLLSVSSCFSFFFSFDVLYTSFVHELVNLYEQKSYLYNTVVVKQIKTMSYWM